MSDDPFEILLIEDNPADVDLTIEALEESRYFSNFNVANDGEEALQFLRKEGKHASSPTPDLILLDLNLPKLGGREVLAEIKKDESLKNIPVVILTGSDSDRDLVRIYELHKNCYVKKPDDLDDFIVCVRKIGNYWLSLLKDQQAKWFQEFIFIFYS